jgi:hypothetical protein
MEQPSLDTLIERVRILEHENVRMKRLGMAAVLVLAAFGVLGQAKPTQIAEKLEARAFVLRDERGLRGALFVADNGVANLVLADKSSRPRFMVTVSGDGDTTAAVMDQAKRPRITLIGSKETFTIGISDSSDTLRTHMTVVSNGESIFGVQDRSGVARATLGVDAAGLVGLTIYNRAGTAIRNFGE